MHIHVDRIEKEAWSVLSEHAHIISFEEKKPREWDRIDYALIVNKDNVPMGFVTCREHDAHTLYWQFGGAFPGTKETSLSFLGYQALVQYVKPQYKRLTTLIENENTAMLKMAMKVGFRIVGIRFYNGSVLLEHVLEFETKNEER